MRGKQHILFHGRTSPTQSCSPLSDCMFVMPISPEIYMSSEKRRNYVVLFQLLDLFWPSDLTVDAYNSLPVQIGKVERMFEDFWDHIGSSS